MGSDQDKPLGIGDIVDGRYEIVDRLGSGGFAKIFKAHQRHVDRFVALKILDPTAKFFDDPTYVERFRREAKMASAVNHRAIVEIFDYGVAGRLNQPFIVMEFLEGYDLHFLLKHVGLFEPRRAIELILPGIEGLAMAHDLGIIHKDLKPGNLFVIKPNTDDEEIRVLDFGIARAKQMRKMTRKGEVAGTPEYLPPEYIDTGEVVAGFDVYQLGLILCEMLTGEPVVDGGNPIAAVIAHTRGVKVPPLIHGTPLHATISRALAKEPADRFPDARALLHSLREVDLDRLESAISESASRVLPLVRPDTVQSTPALNAAALRSLIESGGDRIDSDVMALISGSSGLADDTDEENRSGVAVDPEDLRRDTDEQPRYRTLDVDEDAATNVAAPRMVTPEPMSSSGAVDTTVPQPAPIIHPLHRKPTEPMPKSGVRHTPHSRIAKPSSSPIKNPRVNVSQASTQPLETSGILPAAGAIPPATLPQIRAAVPEPRDFWSSPAVLWTLVLLVIFLMVVAGIVLFINFS